MGSNTGKMFGEPYLFGVLSSFLFFLYGLSGSRDIQNTRIVRGGFRKKTSLGQVGFGMSLQCGKNYLLSRLSQIE